LWTTEVGVVSSVTGTAPVVSSGGATPAISMAAATTSVSGYLTSTDWTTFNGKAGLASPTFTGTVILPIVKATEYIETKVTMGANAIDLATGNYFSKTISGATTLTVSNVATTGSVNSFIFDVTNGGSAVITWFSGVKWVGGTAPTLTTAGRDAVGFFTHDGGTTWSGLVLGKDIK
jgi:hypothetical protein